MKPNRPPVSRTRVYREGPAPGWASVSSDRVQRVSRTSRTIGSGMYWSMRSSPVSPSGMTSISVMSIPLACAHSTMPAISEAFWCFSATVLIFTFKPADSAASMPFSTFETSPRRVICENFSGSSASRDTFTRRTPACNSPSTCSASSVPFVVRVSSSSPCPTRRPRL